MNTAILLSLVLALIVTSFTIAIQPVRADKIVVRSGSQLASAIYGAADGTTIFVNSGTYEIEGLSLVISKSITLTGEDANTTIIRIHPALVRTGGYHLAHGGIEPDYAYDPAIKIQGSDAKISGLTLSSDEGNTKASGFRIQVENCRITTYMVVEGQYQNISQNTITQGIGCYGSYNNIEENNVIGCGIAVEGNGNKIHGNNK
jgi:hypothetical protein